MKNHIAFTCLCSLVCTFAALAEPGTIQTSPLSQEVVPYRILSGTSQNLSKKTKTIFRHLIAVDGASSLQIQFGRTKLPTGAMLRMTSLLDGAVNVADLMAVIDQWGTSGSTADVNNDGIVDVNDLLFISGNWGVCP
jgi:hypothetical protein